MRILAGGEVRSTAAFAVRAMAERASCLKQSAPLRCALGRIVRAALRHILGREPTQRMFTPIASRFSRLRRTTSRLKPIRKRTSSVLRFQFSVENA